MAERFAEQSQYHRIAADDHLQGRARLMAIREGYYAMLHKANEALARAGFESRSHRCTILGLRGVFDAPELTDTLRRAGEERKNVDYGIDPTDPTHVEFDDPQAFVEDTVDQFIGNVDRLVERTL